MKKNTDYEYTVTKVWEISPLNFVFSCVREDGLIDENCDADNFNQSGYFTIPKQDDIQLMLKEEKGEKSLITLNETIGVLKWDEFWLKKYIEEVHNQIWFESEQMWLEDI